jgi:hypothetical protein
MRGDIPWISKMTSCKSHTIRTAARDLEKEGVDKFSSKRFEPKLKSQKQ